MTRVRKGQLNLRILYIALAAAVAVASWSRWVNELDVWLHWITLLAVVASVILLRIGNIASSKYLIAMDRLKRMRRRKK
ncbi:hypothetical protein [Maricaulis sp. MIT060901]|uniref:hypothetical protein n=1 Tax=Maricaulis sp. MIT060901 TaxID=3096993 RepID=UPI00399C3341